MTRPRSLIPALALAGACFWPQPARAQIVRCVDNVSTCASCVPCYPAIMDAVNAAESFDTIEVFPGVYHEAVAISYPKRGLVLRAHRKGQKPVLVAPSGGNDAVTITGAPDTQILNFILEAPEGAGVVVNGGASVVLQGNSVRGPGGIVFKPGNLCMVKDNELLEGGLAFPQGGLSCLIEGNIVSAGGIGIYEGLVQASDNVVRRNLVRSIGLGGRTARGNMVESNTVVGGGIAIGGGPNLNQNVIRNNNVRGGGIVLDGGVEGNTVDSNVVSGSPGDGILVQPRNPTGIANLIRRNTAVANAGCDLNDASHPTFRNTWEANRFGTRCGAAAEQPGDRNATAARPL